MPEGELNAGNCGSHIFRHAPYSLCRLLHSWFPAWGKKEAMKALSLSQPMAWAIFHGKDVENRRWSTKVRGRVYIHASKGFDKGHYNFLGVAVVARLLDKRLPDPGEFVHGAIIGEVDIVACLYYLPDELAILHSPWAVPGQYQFVLANAVSYKTPIPCKGMLKFFEPRINRR